MTSGASEGALITLWRQLVRRSNRSAPAPDRIEIDLRAWAMATFVPVGAAIFLYILHLPPDSNRFGVVSTAALVGLAAYAAGGFIGFLFGIPRRSADSANTDKPTEPGAAAPVVAPSAARFTTNTNLGQVSDWLTTLLIGATLVQLGNIGKGAGKLAELLSEPLGGTEAAPAFATGLIVFLTLAGFAFGYLWTALRLVGALSDAERRSIPNLDDLGTAKKDEQKEEDDEKDAEPTRLEMTTDTLADLKRTFGEVRALEAQGKSPYGAREYAKLGGALKDAGLNSEAAHAYQRAGELDPSKPLYWSQAGVALSRLGDFDGAADQFRRSIAADPGYGWATYNHAASEVKRGDNEAALTLLASLRKRFKEKAKTSPRFKKLRTGATKQRFEQIVGTIDGG